MIVVDITHTCVHTMSVHSYDEPVSIKKIRNLRKNKYNDWKLCTGMHVGTHIDGPGHLTDSDLLLSDVPVNNFVGKGYLIDARNRQIDVSLLKNIPDEKDLIVLFLTGMDKKFGTEEYFSKHPVIPEDVAQGLVRRKIKMVGIDFFSPDTYPFDTHKIFFDNNIFIIENLTNLEQLVGKDFTVVALPIKTATDSALARVVAIINNT